MTDQPIPRIDTVQMLPNLFLRVTFEDGQTRYVRSAVNEQMAVGVSRQVSKKTWGGMMQVSPANYVGANAIAIRDDNTFSVNHTDYDGDDLYRRGRRSYMA
ncbi:hypothetical protein [Lacticaseibacillus daqingensis]|uniref:hypothetical protein n=1 Tax=Lacticaseibacillus daqingensis TaxID=2486014 RepID=UPI000F77F9D9|nr:hypothetical protein [Lacticaseibacillus daqingensis]